MKLGIEVLLADDALKAELAATRVALLAHPASVDRKLVHAVDALFNAGIKLSAMFGPQHGIKGDKQDNMVETGDDVDPRYGIPVFSLYGETVDWPAGGVRPVQYPNLLLVCATLSQDIKYGGDKGIDSAANILQIDEYQIETGEHNFGQSSRLAV